MSLLNSVLHIDAIELLATNKMIVFFLRPIDFSFEPVTHFSVRMKTKSLLQALHNCVNYIFFGLQNFKSQKLTAADCRDTSLYILKLHSLSNFWHESIYTEQKVTVFYFDNFSFLAHVLNQLYSQTKIKPVKHFIAQWF